MDHSSPRGPRGARRGPVLRHHLEDEFDRELDRLHGAGRTRRRERARRADQYERNARRLLEAFLDREVTDPELESLRLVGLDLHAGGGLMTVHVASDAAEDVDDRTDRALRSLEPRLRAELCHELPRRHTPNVRVVLAPCEGGDR